MPTATMWRVTDCKAGHDWHYDHHNRLGAQTSTSSSSPHNPQVLREFDGHIEENGRRIGYWDDPEAGYIRLEDGSIRPRPGSGGSGTVKGRYSGRDFEPAAAGGEIRNLDWQNVKITHQGIDVVERHTNRFVDPNFPDDSNAIMINRLRRIANGEIVATDVDLRYYTHELREYVRYRNLGWETGQPSDMNVSYDMWNNAHTATLEDYQLKEGPGQLYHPDANNPNH